MTSPQTSAEAHKQRAAARSDLMPTIGKFIGDKLREQAKTNDDKLDALLDAVADLERRVAAIEATGGNNGGSND
ncbi:hypothetical protein TKWG_13175 [Advenella kashmirensis WT001]|uniref:Uncharacterized protein n=1 Tax=Advenella kashmirensis (strain DSM 17095 / LMG 22695 / WT001) TaxID=1036672 RepID=I3UCM3_ADVKW|nr:hypothetical protein [Advenella kashmirensis]AFK62761.1 hypothetical protein TKWG_13175 [Advenella kashmirensis WT001]